MVKTEVTTEQHANDNNDSDIQVPLYKTESNMHRCNLTANETRAQANSSFIDLLSPIWRKKIKPNQTRCRARKTRSFFSTQNKIELNGIFNRKTINYFVIKCVYILLLFQWKISSYSFRRQQTHTICHATLLPQVQIKHCMYWCNRVVHILWKKNRTTTTAAATPEKSVFHLSFSCRCCCCCSLAAVKWRSAVRIWQYFFLSNNDGINMRETEKKRIYILFAHRSNCLSL